MAIEDNPQALFKMSDIRLIVGLGNVGKKYLNTRHNAGFIFLEALANNDFREEEKFKAHISFIEVGQEKTYLAKPTTMMNLSGDCVQAIASYYRLSSEKILVVHDDLDIQLGNYKVQFDKGPKVHNGIISIERRLNSSSFWRLRIGIDNRDLEQRKVIQGVDYVLGKFSEEELSKLEIVINEIINEYLSIKK